LDLRCVVGRTVSELPSCVALPKHPNSVVRGILDKFRDCLPQRRWTIEARLHRANKVRPTSYNQNRRWRQYTHSLKVRMRCCGSYVQTVYFTSYSLPIRILFTFYLLSSSPTITPQSHTLGWCLLSTCARKPREVSRTLMG
jgi:hypothetical protein